MKRNTDLDFIRAILIVLMILIHIVSFGNAYPQLKAGILSFMMPTFLIITGYLVNIEKTGRQMGNYLKCLALPYVIMVTGFSVLSYYMPNLMTSPNFSRLESSMLFILFLIFIVLSFSACKNTPFSCI